MSLRDLATLGYCERQRVRLDFLLSTRLVSGTIMSVPHFYQSSEQTCGASCLRMLFAMLGNMKDEATIGQHCRTTALGCTVQDLVAGAQSLGFGAQLLPVYGESDAVTA